MQQPPSYATNRRVGCVMWLAILAIIMSGVGLLADITQELAWDGRIEQLNELYVGIYSPPVPTATAISDVVQEPTPSSPSATTITSSGAITPTNVPVVIIGSASSSTPLPTSTPQPINAIVSIATPNEQQLAGIQKLLPDEEVVFRTLVAQAYVHEMMRDIASKVQQNQVSGMEGFFMLAAVGAMLQGIDPNLDRTYLPPLLEHIEVAKIQQATLRDIAGRWLDKKIDSTVVLTELSNFRPLESVADYVETLRSIGYTSEELEATVIRFQNDMQSVFDEATKTRQ